MHLPVNYTTYSVNVRGVATLTNRWLRMQTAVTDSCLLASLPPIKMIAWPLLWYDLCVMYLTNNMVFCVIDYTNSSSRTFRFGQWNFNSLIFTRYVSLYGEIIQFTDAPYWSSAKLTLATWNHIRGFWGPKYDHLWLLFAWL